MARVVCRVGLLLDTIPLGHSAVVAVFSILGTDGCWLGRGFGNSRDNILCKNFRPGNSPGFFSHDVAIRIITPFGISADIEQIKPLCVISDCHKIKRSIQLYRKLIGKGKFTTPGKTIGVSGGLYRAVAPGVQGISSVNVKVPPVDLFLPGLISSAVAVFGKKGNARDDESKQRDNKSFQFAPRAVLKLQIILQKDAGRARANRLTKSHRESREN